MNKLEERLRDGLHGAADRFPEVGTSVIRESSTRRRWSLSGPAVALAAAAAVVVLVGGISLLTSIPDNQDGATSIPTVVEEPAPWFIPDTFESTFQREIIEDGVVTFEEFTLAMSALVECLQDEGFEATGSVERSGASELSWVVGRSQASAQEQARFDSALEGCQREYFTQIDTFYSLTHPQEWVDPITSEVSGEIGACMANLGVNLKTTPEGTQAWYAALDILGDDAWMTFRQCEAEALPPVLEEVQPPPGG